MRNLMILAAAAFCALSWALPAIVAAQDDPATLERRVKAAFVYKFAGYVEWPEATLAQPAQPITIGVMGDDAIVGELTQVVAGRTIEGHPLTVRRVRNVDAAMGVHVLFVSHAERAKLSELKSLNAPMLIISESDGALEQGSIINFVIVGGRVRFEVALDNAERRNLKLSSRLLTVAHFVRMAAQ